jgi:hypothetical protein
MLKKENFLAYFFAVQALDVLLNESTTHIFGMMIYFPLLQGSSLLTVSESNLPLKRSHTYFESSFHHLSSDFSPIAFNYQRFLTWSFKFFGRHQSLGLLDLLSPTQFTVTYSSLLIAWERA